VTADPRECRCDALEATGEFSVRRLPAPEVSYEAACTACGTVYWLSAAEAERSLDAAALAKGRAALAEMTSRTGAAEAVAARSARRRFAFLRPIRDALVIALRRLLRPWARKP
jgi:hypothetical protein